MGDGDCNTDGEDASLPLSPTVKTLVAQIDIEKVKKMANCETCKKAQSAPENVPYIVHEASMARMERQIKRLWIAVIVSACMLFASNLAWLYAWCQYDYSSEETIYQQDGESTNIIGDSNEVGNYGAENDNP